MAYKIPKLEKWSDKILRDMTIPHNDPPDDWDIDVARLALEGKTIAAILKVFQNLKTPQVMASLKRVRDAVRHGNPPESIRGAFPNVVEWQLDVFRAENRPAHETHPRPPKPPSTELQGNHDAQSLQISRISRTELKPALNHLRSVVFAETAEVEHHERSHEFSRAFHARILPDVAKIAIVKLCDGMMRDDAQMISRGLDIAGFPGTRTRAFNQLIQIGKPLTPTSGVRGAVSFEKLLREARSKGLEAAVADSVGPKTSIEVEAIDGDDGNTES